MTHEMYISIRTLRLVSWWVFFFQGVSTLFGSFKPELIHIDKSFEQFRLM